MAEQKVEEFEISKEEKTEMVEDILKELGGEYCLVNVAQLEDLRQRLSEYRGDLEQLMTALLVFEPLLFEDKSQPPAKIPGYAKLLPKELQAIIPMIPKIKVLGDSIEKDPQKKELLTAVVPSIINKYTNERQEE